MGNVLSFIFFSEKIFSHRFEVRQLTTDHSRFNLNFVSNSGNSNLNNVNINNIISTNNNLNLKLVTNSNIFDNNQSYISNNINKTGGVSSKTNNLVQGNDEKEKEMENEKEKYNSYKHVKSLLPQFNLDDEVRRIYEKGGEIRTLAGESIYRIFVKGKYFPGLINTRSLGDVIGKEIGIISEPHIVKYRCEDKYNYYLVMCSDGVSNNISIEKMMSIIESNYLCK